MAEIYDVEAAPTSIGISGSITRQTNRAEKPGAFLFVSEIT